MNLNSDSDKSFLNRLTAIVDANLSNEQFGVNELAAKTGLSRSQIHRRLKSICNKSVSQFIREVRLEKAKELLEDATLTSSEIAYKVGFGSPSYFIKSFRDYFGYPPGEYLKYAPEDSGKEENPAFAENTVTNKPEVIKSGKSLKWIFPILVLVSTVVIIYLIIQNRNFKITQNHGEKSIIVLPLKNLSSDENTQHFSQGLSNEIRNQLAKIPELKVISGPTADQFREGTPSSPEIARQVNAQYILAGSIQQQDNDVHINIELSDARHDRILWTGKYNWKNADIFAIYIDIAKNVTNNLQLILSPEEIKQIEKLHPKNFEAYNNYLMGRYFLYQRPEEKCKNSIVYFEKAIEADPNYSDAYAGLSNAYQVLTWHKFFPLQEGKTKSKQYALKALSLNENQTEGHVVLGSLEMWFNWNWDAAEKEFIQALKLNPKHPEANQYYSEYLDIMGKTEAARFYLDKAIKLYPYSKIMYAISSNYYLREKNYLAALKENQKVLEFDAHDELALWRNFRIYFHLNEDKKTIEELKRILSLKKPNDKARETIDSLYADNQMNEIIHWTIEWIEENEDLDDFYIATIAALIRDRETTLKYLNRAVNNSFRAPRIKFYPDFVFLQNDPEFQTIIEKLNLLDD